MIMSKQPDALRLAQIVEFCGIREPISKEIAAELRRLHAENEAARASAYAYAVQGVRSTKSDDMNATCSVHHKFCPACGNVLAFRVEVT